MFGVSHKVCPTFFEVKSLVPRRVGDRSVRVRFGWKADIPRRSNCDRSLCPVEPWRGYNELLGLCRRSEGADQLTCMALPERRPLDPFAFKEIRFSIGKLTDLSRPF